LFEVKYDGFRSLAYIENGTCKLVSRNEYDYKRFADLRDALPAEIHAKDAIVDGELVVLDGSGKARFDDYRGTVVFTVFDVMWLDGRICAICHCWSAKRFCGIASRLRLAERPSSITSRAEGRSNRSSMRLQATTVGAGNTALVERNQTREPTAALWH